MLSTSCETGLSWVPQNFNDDKWTSVQVITWANVDPNLDNQMTSTGHKELKDILYKALQR